MIGKINLNPALARQFLSALYSSFFSQKSALAFMEVRGKAESGPMSFRRFYRSPEALLKDMARWKPGLNYWIGVALRRDNRGGKKENLLALTAAFCDVDVGPAGSIIFLSTPGQRSGKSKAKMRWAAFQALTKKQTAAMSWPRLQTTYRAMVALETAHDND